MDKFRTLPSKLNVPAFSTPMGHLPTVAPTDLKGPPTPRGVGRVRGGRVPGTSSRWSHVPHTHPPPRHWRNEEVTCRCEPGEGRGCSAPGLERPWHCFPPAAPPTWAPGRRQGCSADSATQVGLLEPDRTELGGKTDGGGAKRELAAHGQSREKQKQTFAPNEKWEWEITTEKNV